MKWMSSIIGTIKSYDTITLFAILIAFGRIGRKIGRSAPNSPDTLSRTFGKVST